MTKQEVLARPQKGSEHKLTLDEAQLLYYRLHPIQAVKDIFGIDLIWLQRITFRQMWFKRYCLLNMSRGVGKTFLIAIFSILRAMLYPKERIGVIAPVFRQAGYVFDEIELLMLRSPYFVSSTVKGQLSRSMSAFSVKFYNGSMVEALPLGDGTKVRGRRYSIGVLDEYAQLDDSIIKLVIRPMLNIKIAGRENRMVIASTAYYKWNHFWGQYVHYYNMIQRKPDQYFVAEYDYHDVVMVGPISPYSIDLDIIEMQRADSTEEDFAMENLCKFPDETAGFFTSRMIEACTPRPPAHVPIEYEPRQDRDNDPDAIYVMGLDCARAEGGDNFVCSLLKITKRGRLLVHVETANGQTYQDMTNIVRRKIRDFNIVRIHLATRGGGRTLKDLLAEPYVDIDTGDVFPRILDMDDEQHLLMEGIHLIKMVEENAPKNHEMYHRLKSDMQHKRVFFPIDIRRDPDREIERLGQENVRTKREMLVLLAVPRGLYHHFETPEADKFKKDRVTGLVLANDAAHELQHPDLEAQAIPLAVGGWIR